MEVGGGGREGGVGTEPLGWGLGWGGTRPEPLPFAPVSCVPALGGGGKGVTPIPYIGDRPRDGVGPLPDPHPPLPPPLR